MVVICALDLLHALLQYLLYTTHEGSLRKTRNLSASKSLDDRTVLYSSMRTGEDDM